jgi:hypothetical protein
VGTVDKEPSWGTCDIHSHKILKPKFRVMSDFNSSARYRAVEEEISCFASVI